MTELVKVDAHAARSVAGRIRQGVRDYLATLALVKRAWDEEHWRVLGYDSWQDYVDGEFGADRLGLPMEHRDKALNDLRMSGMSVRQIAATTGVPKSTIAREVSQLGHLTETVTGADGKTYAATRQTPAPMPEPGPEASTSTGPGHDNPQSRAGEAHAGPGTQVTDPRPAPEADRVFRGTPEAGDVGPAEDFPPPPARPDPLDDPEHIERQHREGSSDAVAEALVAVKMRLEPDPVRWLTETWIPGRYRFRDMPRVRDCFTPDGLRTSAKYLEILADHLDATGGTL